MRATFIVRQALASSTERAGIERRLFSSCASSSASSAAVAKVSSPAKKKLEAKPAQAKKSTPLELGSSLIRRIAEEHQLPRFVVPTDNVHLYESPERFYSELLHMISRARRRIFIASLYIGKTETELISHLRTALNENSQLELTILVDSLRSTREGRYKGTPKSSSCASLLAKLQVDFPNRVNVRLYRAPGLPGWLEKLVGKRFVEGWGLQHMKIYGVDDEVMTSGANLSNDYFTNRRDRYIRMEDDKISQYMYSLLMIAARFSFSLRGFAPVGEKTEPHHASYDLLWDEGKSLPMEVDSLRDYGPLAWKDAMSREIRFLTKKWHKTQRGILHHTAHKNVKSSMVEFVPLLQMGPLQIQQETECIPAVMKLANNMRARIDFTTGYFSINPKYAELILKGRFMIDIITASPKANGFYGSKGISKHLPAAYTWLEKLFWERTLLVPRVNKIVMREWYKPGWTYHAKGIWLYNADHLAPAVTLLGSSNFGTRSAHLDLECTMLIDASNSSLIQQHLRKEVQNLQKDADDVVGKEMFKRKDRRVALWVRLATYLIKKML